MARTSWALGGLAAASLLTALWLYRDNRRLSDQLARAQRPVPTATADPWASSSPRSQAPVAAPAPRSASSAPPTLPAAPTETRMERRNRRSLELAAMLGRLDGESEAEYRARLLPLMGMALERPRHHVAEMRRAAEDKAGVTPEQRAALDAAFGEVYDELIPFTDAAIADGQLSPYTRNVTGMLEYAGGLGTLLSTAENKVGTVLSPAQRKAMYDAGFEWGEYLGVSAPWERLRPPPPAPAPPGGS